MPSVKRTNSSLPSACSHSGKRAKISLDADLSDSALLYERGTWRRLEEHPTSALCVVMTCKGHAVDSCSNGKQVSRIQHAYMGQTPSSVSGFAFLTPWIPVLSLQADAGIWRGSCITHLLKESIWECLTIKQKTFLPRAFEEEKE